MAKSLFISVKEAPHCVISSLIHNPFQTHHGVCVCFSNRGEESMLVGATPIIS